MGYKGEGEKSVIGKESSQLIGNVYLLTKRPAGAGTGGS